MDDVEAAQARDRLLEALDGLCGLLDEAGLRWWADRLRADRRRVARWDRQGITDVLARYGGMGSLNDLVAPIAASAHDPTVVDDAAKAAAQQATDRIREAAATVWAEAHRLLDGLASGDVLDGGDR